MDIQLIKRQEDFLARCATLRVMDQETLTKANAWASFGKEVIKDIKAWFAPHKDRAWQAHKELCKSEDAELAKVEPIVIRLDQEVKAYALAEAEKRRVAEEERRQLEAEAMRRAQEAENLARREQKEAERKALEAEAKAKDEQNAALRKKAQEEAERIRRDAELQKREAEHKFQAEQDRILAEAAARESVMAPVPRAPVMTSQVMRDNWKAEVVNFLELIQAVQTGRVSTEALLANMEYLNSQATKTKASVLRDGVRFYNDPIVMKVGKRGA